MAVNPIIPPTLLQKLPYPSFIITTMLEYKEMLVAIFCFIFLLHWRRNRNSLFTDWPILRMLPSLLYNLPNIHDHVTQTLKKNGGTGQFIAPWFTQSSAVLTCDAMNVLHITSTNFRNYDKGPEFREIFEVLGNGVLTDSKEWKYSRELLHSLFKKRNFHMFLDKIVQKKVESCLFPFLDHVEKKRMEVDLQDVFNRFTFDNICCMVLGFDPNCLSIDLPLVVYEKFFGEAQVALFYRMVVPRSLWKLQKWLGIGKERKMSEARKVSELLFNEFIRCKRKQQDKSGDGVEEADFELLSEIMMMEEEKKGQMDDKLIRDNVLNILSAGKDTLTAGLSWFFWLVAAHPSVEAKILEELKENFPTKEEKRMVLGKKEVEKLVYLHATICEAMRLFPQYLSR
ncbi:hypothetical protein L6164_017070 [Bauhinia variegata]|uniref:Uncharacterized protein n=1 Tax=Bauhinia variegata TaxID=167791 RepID=A0ACB9N7A8_BAUVA|nr:hypothetical protein L6164_017070 [Bauhinia variegata]